MGLSLDMWRTLAKGATDWRTTRPPHAEWAASLWEEADAKARAAELELHDGWMSFYTQRTAAPAAALERRWALLQAAAQLRLADALAARTTRF